MQAKLTTTTIKGLRAADKPYEVFDTEIRGFLLRVEPTGVMTYYLAYIPREGKRAGRRRRYRIGRHTSLTVRQARDEAEKWAAAVIAGRDPQEEKETHRKEAEMAKFSTLRGFLDHKYGPWVTSHRKRGEETLGRLKTNFRELLDQPLSEITPWLIEKWRSAQKRGGKTVATINRDISDLRAALTMAVDWELVSAHPLAKVKRLKTDTNRRVRYLSSDEDKRLRNALADRDARIKHERAGGNRWRRQRGYTELQDLQGFAYADHLTPLVLLTLNTGLRRGEAFSLQWENVNLQARTITIEGGLSKSGSTRHIPINDEAISVLKRWRDQSGRAGLVFPGREGNPLVSVRKIWARLLKDASIETFRWHDLRHSFASNLVMKGVPLNTVRELLGHQDMSTALRYAHLAPDHKAEAVARLNE